MGIWLVGKTVDGLVKVPLSIGSGRINIKPNLFNEMYEFKNLSFHYQLISAVPTMFGFDIGHGKVTRAQHRYEDANGKFQKLTYWGIEICDTVPDEFRDVIFLHELIELQNLEKGLSQPVPHKLAVEQTEDYILNKLSSDEQARFREWHR